MLLKNLLIRITLIRMTPARLISTLVVALALAGVATVAGASPERGDVVVVADASAPRSAVTAALRSAGPDAELRVPRTATEQLSVTHLFAARGYDVVGVGLDRRIAVDPVARNYPQVRLVLRDARH
jgi:hypothetical protein